MPPTQRQLQVGNGEERSQTVGFNQQGSVDWVAFANTIFSATLNVCQRLAGYNVQPITYGCSLALGARFQLGQIGTRRVDEALKQLSSRWGYGNIVQFGFGIQAMVYTLAETQEGVNIIGLISSLTNTHNEALVARILAELWQLESFPDQYRPSHSQFVQLAKACSGVLLNTSLSGTIDIVLADLSRFRQDGRLKTTTSAADPSDVAKALQGLFKISRGDVDRITITGGAESVFLAALATWLFDLRVYVEDGNGNLMFNSNVRCDDDVQVLVRCTDPSDNRKVVLAETTYILRPHDHREFLVESGDDRILELTFRTPWDKCLSRVFGSLFKNLCALERHLASYLGSVARVYTALVRCEKEVGNFWRTGYINFSETSYGLGFIATVIGTFPEIAELADAQHLMQEELEVSFTTASNHIEGSINCIKAVCTCSLCKHRYDVRKNIGSAANKEPCLVALALAIRQIALLMSCVVQHGRKSIDPAIRGIEYYYDRSWGAWELCLSGLDFQSSVCGLHLFKERPKYEFCTSDILMDVQTLLVGSRPPDDEIDNDFNLTASTNSGICCYLDALREPSCKPEHLGRVHVISGNISHDSRRFDGIYDGANTPFDATNAEEVNFLTTYVSSEQEMTTEMSHTEPRNSPHHQQLDYIPLAAERYNGGGLTFYYKVTVVNGDKTSYFRIQPGTLTSNVLLASGLVPCSTSTSSKCNISGEDFAIPFAIVERGWYVGDQAHSQLKYQAGIACLAWNKYANTDLKRCLVASLSMRNKARLFIRGSSCNACCSREVSRLQLAPGTRKQLVFVL
jgi:hypothetical protein